MKSTILLLSVFLLTPVAPMTAPPDNSVAQCSLTSSEDLEFPLVSEFSLGLAPGAGVACVDQSRPCDAPDAPMMNVTMDCWQVCAECLDGAIPACIPVSAVDGVCGCLSRDPVESEI